MLPPFIIEQIRKREERQSIEERPMLELPLERPPLDQGSRVLPVQEGDAPPQRGVIVLDL